MITPRFQSGKIALAMLIAGNLAACASTGFRVPKYNPGSGRMAPIPNPPEPERPRASPEPQPAPPPPPVERRETPRPEPEKPKPAPPAPSQKTDPAQAARLRAKGLEQLDRGAINRAVALLRQAHALDPDNALIKRDLDRAERISKVVHSRH